MLVVAALPLTVPLVDYTGWFDRWRFLRDLSFSRSRLDGGMRQVELLHLLAVRKSGAGAFSLGGRDGVLGAPSSCTRGPTWGSGGRRRGSLLVAVVILAAVTRC
jgi:hypothetical protein